MLARKARAAGDVVLASLAVARARRIVATRPVGALVERTRTSLPEQYAAGLALALPPGALRSGARWGVAVDRVLRWLPGDSACLVRASALRELVAADGVPNAIVVIGVRRGAAGFEAHAWVEQDGTPIAEPASMQGAFSALEGVTVR